MLWISNHVYLNQAYLRGGIEKCCRKKKLRRKSYWKGTTQKSSVKVLWRRYASTNSKTWSVTQFYKKVTYFSGAGKAYREYIQQSFAEREWKNSGSVEEKKISSYDDFCLVAKACDSRNQCVPRVRGEGREWWENCSPHWLQPVLTLKDQKSLYKVHHDPSDSWLKKWKNSKSLFWK